MVRRRELEVETYEKVDLAKISSEIPTGDWNFFQFNLRMKSVTSYNRGFRGLAKATRNLAQEVEKFLLEMQKNERFKGEAFRQFQKDWKYIRLCIGLQARLLVEQVCYDMGYPWRRLFTGFNPIE